VIRALIDTGSSTVYTEWSSPVVDPNAVSFSDDSIEDPNVISDSEQRNITAGHGRDL